jgi:hypothetical protein
VAGTQLLTLALSALTAWQIMLVTLLGFSTLHFINEVELPFGPALVYYANIWFAHMIMVNMISDRFIPTPKQKTES